MRSIAGTKTGVARAKGMAALRPAERASSQSRSHEEITPYRYVDPRRRSAGPGPSLKKELDRALCRLGGRVRRAVSAIARGTESIYRLTRIHSGDGLGPQPCSSAPNCVETLSGSVREARSISPPNRGEVRLLPSPPSVRPSCQGGRNGWTWLAG
jgi:hypothetical protein